MTVYSHATIRTAVIGTSQRSLFGAENSGMRTKRQSTPVTLDDKWYKINMAIAVMAVIFILIFIFMSNFVVSQKYILNMRKVELSRLNLKSTADDQSLGVNNFKELIDFANKSGLVEAKDIDSIKEENGLALVR